MIARRTVFILALCWLAQPSALFADGSLERVVKAGKLLVAIDPTYPPMEYEQDGKLLGFDVDVAREIARRLGVQAEFVTMDWNGIIAGLNSRRYDMIISSMNITPEREKQVGFVEYVRMAQVFVCPQGTVVANEGELAGKVVAVQADTTSFKYVEDLKKKGVAIRDIKAPPQATDTFSALKAGQAEVVVTDEPVGRYYAKSNPDFVVTGQAIATEPVGIAVNKQDVQLREAIAKAVASMQQDGTFRKISTEWFNAELGRDVVAEQTGFWDFSWRVVLPRIWVGMQLTLLLTVMSGCCGVLLGLCLSLMRVSRNWALSRLALAYVTLFRGTPLLLQIFFVYYALPPLLGIRLDSMTSGVLALSLNAAAYITEIFRAAIQSIDRGQMEAARALGMNYRQAMRRVILPQTFRRLIPPLVNELAALSKDTSLASVLTLHEILYETNRLAAAYLRPWEVYAWAALGYLLIVMTLTALASWLERRLEAREA